MALGKCLILAGLQCLWLGRGAWQSRPVSLGTWGQGDRKCSVEAAAGPDSAANSGCVVGASGVSQEGSGILFAPTRCKEKHSLSFSGLELPLPTLQARALAAPSLEGGMDPRRAPPCLPSHQPPQLASFRGPPPAPVRSGLGLFAVPNLPSQCPWPFFLIIFFPAVGIECRAFSLSYIPILFQFLNSETGSR